MAKKQKTKTKHLNKGGTVTLTPLTVTVGAIGPDSLKILSATAYLDNGTVATGWLNIYDGMGDTVPLKLYLDKNDMPSAGCRLLIQNSTIGNGVPTFSATLTGIETDISVNVVLKDGAMAVGKAKRP